MYDIDDDLKDDLLQIVQMECARAVGFDNVGSGELTEQRERALLYARGEMPDLVMELQGRSKVVSLDVADAIETALPDLLDIFTGGDDVVSFEPVSQDDVEAAQQETDYLKHVLFNKNGGWRVLYEAFKDALLCKTGVLSWRWDGEFVPPTEEHNGKSLMELQRAMQEGIVEELAVGEPDESGLPTWSYSYRPRAGKGRIIIEAIPSEDLAVAPDTKTLKDSTYCVVRQRPRAQDLIAMGYDRDVIDSLPAWNNNSTQPEMTARDTVDETQFTAQSVFDLRQVEIYRHYVRRYEPDEKKWCCYQIVTGGRGYVDTLIDVQEVSRIQLAALTPYMVPHRFYGESVADKLMEIQKIKSSLMRMLLDSGYFSLNQRHEIVEGGCTADTLDDYLNNEPGMPVRVKVAGTINPLGSAGLPIDALAHLEYFSTVAEQRTGIVRNAQGLNPDTLHDTAKGLEVLANNAQKRLRMIARTFAETGYKDFLVGLHATIREYGSSVGETVRLRGKDWIEIDPSTWRQRDDMLIEVGVGAGGREHDLLVGQQLAAIQEKLIEAQNLPDGPLIDKRKLYNSAVFVLKRLGLKSPEEFIGNPEEFVPPEPQPDPAQMEMQAKAQFERQKLELETAKADHNAMLKEREAQTDLELQRMKLQAELQIAREKLDAEMQLAREKAMMEAELQRERYAMEGALKVRQQDTDAEISSGVRFGGDVG